MTTDFSKALAAYAVHDISTRAAHDRNHIRTRFTAPGDDYPIAAEVPAAAHVARHVVLPSLTSPSAPTLDEIEAALLSIPHRTHGGYGVWTPPVGREHLDDTRNTRRRLTPYYRGLYVAMTHDPAPGMRPTSTFSREAYLRDVHAETVAALRPDVVAPVASGPGNTPDPAAVAQARHDERTARNDRRTTAVRAALLAMIADGTIAPSAPISRADLFEALQARLPEELPSRLVANLAVKVAAELGLVDRRVRHADRTRSRGFILIPTVTIEGPADMSIDDQAEALHRLADAADRATGALARFDEQRERLAARDIVGALTVHAERHSDNVVPAAHRFRRTA